MSSAPADRPLPLRDRRLLLGECAVLSVAEAVKLLPGRESKVRALLAREGVVRDLDGTPCVIWADVLALVRGEGPEPGPQPSADPPRPSAPLPRVKLS